MTQEDSKESFRTNLESLLSQKLNEHQSFSTSLESLSKYCENFLKEFPKAHSSLSQVKTLNWKLVQSLETLSASSDLSLFLPILRFFSQTFQTSNYLLTGALVNALCVFLISHHPPCPGILKECLVRIIDILYLVGIQKKKKSEGFDPAWKGKVFIVFCDLFEELAKDSLNGLASETVELSDSLLINDESKISKLLKEIDLELYLALAITHLGKHVSIPSCDTLISSISQYLTSISFSLSSKQSNPLLIQEKSVICFSILSTISILLNKVENFRTILKLNWESIMNLFTFTIISIKTSSNLNNFTEDPSIAGQLYTEILDLSVCCISSELESFPISLFVQLNKFVIFIQDTLGDAEETIVKYSLQLIRRFCKLGVKKSRIGELGIVELMFSDIFFRFHLSDEWQELWEFLNGIPDNLTWLPEKIMNALNSLVPSRTYLAGLIAWLNEKISFNENFVIFLADSQLFAYLFEGLSRLPDCKETCIELFVMIKSFIHSFEISEKLNLKIAEFLISDGLIESQHFYELALSCFGGLLKKSGLCTYEALIILLNNTSRLCVLQKVLETIQDALKETEYKKKCQEMLGKVGIFRSFKKVLQGLKKKIEIITLWPAVLECVRFLIQNNLRTKGLLPELDFLYLTEMLICDYIAFAEELSLACVEIVMYILFDSTNLEIFHEVQNPEIMPLAVAMFSCCHSHLASYVLSMVDYTYNAVQLALTGFISIVNKRTPESNQFRTLAAFLEKAICFSISPLDFTEFLVILKELPIWKQEVLLESLAKGAEKAFVNNAETGVVTLSPTTYYWFHKPSSHLTFSSETFQFLPKKDFTILAWVLPLSKSRSCLFTLIDKKQFFQVFIEEESLEIIQTIDKKLIFKLKTQNLLQENQWNLISITCQQITKFITSSSNYSVFINNRLCELIPEGKVSNTSPSFHTLVLGNSFDLECCFNGKLSNFLIFSKAFQDFSEFYSCGNFLFLPFIDKSFSEFHEIDHGKMKEFWNEVWFQVNAKDQVFSAEDVFVDDLAERVHGTDLVTCLATLGGVNVFLPILKDSENKVALEILSVISCFCQVSCFEKLADKDFFTVLAGAIEPLVLPSEELLETFKKIIARLEWNSNLQRESFKHLMINSGIWNNLNENLQENYIGSISLYIHKHLKCSLEDIIEFYSHFSALAPLPLDFLTEVFVKVLPKFLEFKDFDAFCYILFRLANDNIELLNNFLLGMTQVTFGKDCLRETTFVFLNFLEWPLNESIFDGLLSVVKKLVGQLAYEMMTDKKSWSDDNTLKHVFLTLDRKFGFETTKEIFKSIPEVSKLSFSYTSRHIPDKNLNFLERLSGKSFLLDPSTDEDLNFFSHHNRTCSAPDVSSSIQPNEDISKLYYNFVLTKQEELKSSSQSLSNTFQVKKQVRLKKFKKIIKKFSSPEPIDFNRAKVKVRWNFDALGRIATCKFEEKSDLLTPRKPTMVSTPTKIRNSFIHTRNSLLFETFTDDTDTITQFVAETEEDFVEEPAPELKQSVILDCERIKVTCSVFGYIEISQESLIFVSEGKEKPEGGIYFPSALKFMQECKKSLVFLQVSEISEVFPRRYIHKHSAFEIFLLTGRSYLFNVFSPEHREKAFEAMKSWKNVKIVTDPSGSLLRNCSKKWKRGEISNLEYLLLVNRFASRSFHDLSQYPVFPWVLKDYTSLELHLDDPAVYRNLKLPIGAQTEEARAEAEQRFNMGLDDYPYHFGSHYSSGAVVLHYMLRLEPFSELSRNLQGGTFDIPDRLFHSLQSTWESGQGSSGDVKELIPEMFYMPEILKNSNNENFGKRQDGEPVLHVRLPPWASSAEDFCRKHQSALESPIVSQQLHLWIDLIFGVKQKGKQARQAFNVFSPMSYEENFKKVLESGESESYLQGMTEQVVHFGQTPVKVFHSNHVTRDVQGVQASIFDKYRKLDGNFTSGCQVSGDICAVLLTSKYLLLIKRSSFKVSLLRISLNDLDENSVMFERKKEKVLQGCKFLKESLNFSFCTLGENKLVSGKHWDFSFKIHSLSGTLISSVFEHSALVSCVCQSENLLITGSLDGSVISWDFNSRPRLLSRFLGNRAGIIQVFAVFSCSLLFTLNTLGQVFIFDSRSAEFLQMISTKFVKISVSGAKLIAGVENGAVSVVNLQNSQVFKRFGNFQFVCFDKTGEYLCYCKDFAWGFWGIFDEFKKFEKKEDGFLNAFLVADLQNYFVYSLASGKYSFVYTFGGANKDNLMPSQRINF